MSKKSLSDTSAGVGPDLWTGSGKYKSVRTSSEEFIARKADELRLEHS